VTDPDLAAPSDATTRDVTGQKQALVEARAKEQLWRAVLATAVDPIIVIDQTGTILEANAATSRLFGYEQPALVGSNVSMLMPEPYRSEHDGYIRRYIETGEAKIIGIGREVEAQRADGTLFPIALAVSEVVDPAGNLYAGIIHDLSDLRAATDSLRRANEQLEQRVEERTAALEQSMEELARSNRDLEHFAYIASHDLQAPLRNVRQGLELLDEHLLATVGSRFDDEAEELRGLVVAAVSRMEELIQGLLMYSRVQRGSSPSRRVVDLAELADEVVKQLRLDLDEAGAIVVTDDLPAVLADPVQLRQVLQNLIQNAVKYHAPGRQPKIVITARGIDGQWAISVADNGIGVNSSLHERIFELFRRGHPDYEGVGLGLSIAQRIVERHGGRIWVNSEPNEGATFTFTLPKESTT